MSNLGELGTGVIADKATSMDSTSHGFTPREDLSKRVVWRRLELFPNFRVCFQVSQVFLKVRKAANWRNST